MKLKKLDALNKPYKIYAEVLDNGSIEQFVDVMSHPAIVQGALMPDAHSGYVLPIGGAAVWLTNLLGNEENENGICTTESKAPISTGFVGAKEERNKRETDCPRLRQVQEKPRWQRAWHLV